MTINTKKIDLLSDLNEKQNQAVKYFDKHLRIIAGAGTGKTKVLTRKIAYLINILGIPAKNILGVTFTNKAAQEMSIRVEKYCNNLETKLNIKTFHSFCATILRNEIHNLGYRNSFTIVDEPDKIQILSAIYKKLGITSSEISYKSAIHYISTQKNNTTDYNQFYNIKNMDQIEDKIYFEYINELARNGALDFDDLIIKTNILFHTRPDIVEKYKKLYSYILVDEFQDTSKLQYRIIKSLIGKNTHLTIVGDPDQTIYNWRGADVNLILDFEKDFKETFTVVLDKNYRSTQKILDAANKLIKMNKKRYNKDLVTENGVGADIEFMHSFSEEGEAKWVVNKINQLKKQKNQLKSIVILYRANYYSRAFEQALIDENIPHKIINGVKFYQRSEIKDAIAFLRLLHNNDELSFYRIVNVPTKGIGHKAIETIKEFVAKKGNLNTFETITNKSNWSEFKREHPNLAVKLFKFLQITIRYKKELRKLEITKHSISKILDFYLMELDYYHFIEKDTSLRGTAIENVKELIASIKTWEEKNKEKKLADYLNYINLLSVTDDYEGNTNYVTLMTIHSAKGLEYDNVFLVGLSRGVFPSYRIIEKIDSDPETFEEERRLAYVGITRARNNLFLSSSRGKIFGTDLSKEPSRFITEMGINVDNYTNMNDDHGLDLDYSPDEISLINSKMIIGDIISHTIFGEGEVVDFGSGNEVLVRFRDGKERTLNKRHHSIRIISIKE
ncbi:ATP-dependent helicase [Mycoplasma sp. CSL10166]|uniref:ATP-dependent helicase n=1 Tax=Mycoplasma sp. CSL10166 TaxID=2813825 RepID=UPI00197C3C5E|nr:UvrD-helicase domain-containing protein [Mycoplasma sp. CSL10166]MBN4084506.1 UvrD-helicase domain-containing protein [Mycoplasma sp. CSL10166]